MTRQLCVLALKSGTAGEGFQGAPYNKLVLRSSTQILGASLNQGAPLQVHTAISPTLTPYKSHRQDKDSSPFSSPLGATFTSSKSSPLSKGSTCPECDLKGAATASWHHM